MLVVGSKPETLPVTVRRDASTGLPLLSEGDLILEYLMAYLPLPYSVAEHGCGKKASLIIDRLLELELPPYALWRGLILERDMSPAALAERDAARRPHALVSDNPLCELSDLRSPDLHMLLRESCPGIRIEGDRIHAGDFVLHHEPRVQYVIARSHVYPIVWFWDASAGAPAPRVIDPTLARRALFPVADIRGLLRAPEALIFSAPLLGHLRLDPELLTEAQRAEVLAQLGDDRRLVTLSVAEHAALVRSLNGAERGSLGDPEAWTYSNNMLSGDPGYDGARRRRTGRGERQRKLLHKLVAARSAFRSDVHELRRKLLKVSDDADLPRMCRADARWSEEQLEPLADLAMAMAYHKTLGQVAERIGVGADLLDALSEPALLEEMRGMAGRMRRRIDLLARASEDDDGEIDARALGSGFTRATLETIRQMTLAGLSVHVDRVGNLHGVDLDAEDRAALEDGTRSLREVMGDALVFGSHIDSVKDAGRFDGRLGVTAGIEVAHALRDLERFFGLGSRRPGAPRLAVSAFIGEEMTFTGRSVSMPGSAAVSGRASTEDVHAMTNGDGERFGDRLVEMLKVLRREQLRGAITLRTRFDGDAAEELLAACAEPTDFYSRHSYERHIEQGPVLDRSGVPMALVGTIMGIHQEDFHFEGDAAEAAALELVRRMRMLTREPRFSDVRITAGILDAQGPMRIHERPAVAFRWTLVGEKNHAGATATADRRDPLVAAARLARALYGWLDDNPEVEARGITPAVGNVRVVPGKNRNVIPGEVSVTLALLGSAELTAWEIEALEQELRGYAIGTLVKSVPIGGEGMHVVRAEPISYATIAPVARLSIDLRAADRAVIERFRVRTEGILEELRDTHAVDVRSELQQRQPPFGLRESGQVLLMERSYGGSHNPSETEMLVDITRGCILQLAVARELLAGPPLQPDFNLFDFVEQRMPERWLSTLSRYTSGALHDTCNIAARALGV